MSSTAARQGKTEYGHINDAKVIQNLVTIQRFYVQQIMVTHVITQFTVSTFAKLCAHTINLYCGSWMVCWRCGNQVGCVFDLQKFQHSPACQELLMFKATFNKKSLLNIVFMYAVQKYVFYAIVLSDINFSVVCQVWWGRKSLSVQNALFIGDKRLKTVAPRLCELLDKCDKFSSCAVLHKYYTFWSGDPRWNHLNETGESAWNEELLARPVECQSE